MPHKKLGGYQWAGGRTGIVFSLKAGNFLCSRPDIKNFPEVDHQVEGVCNVVVDHPQAKGGYAFVSVPEDLLALHYCTLQCPRTHPCEYGTRTLGHVTEIRKEPSRG